MKNLSGFTIIELLITVSVLGILIAIALPNYNAFVKNNCLTTATNDLITSLQVARSEAIKRRMDVGVYSAAWANGWTVFADADDDTTMDAGEEVRVFDRTCGTGLVTIAEASNETTFMYNSEGFIDNAGSFEICDDRSDETGRQVTISITGRASTDTTYAGCNP